MLAYVCIGGVNVDESDALRPGRIDRRHARAARPDRRDRPDGSLATPCSGRISAVSRRAGSRALPSQSSGAIPAAPTSRRRAARSPALEPAAGRSIVRAESTRAGNQPAGDSGLWRTSSPLKLVSKSGQELDRGLVVGPQGWLFFHPRLRMRKRLEDAPTSQTVRLTSPRSTRNKRTIAL